MTTLSRSFGILPYGAPKTRAIFGIGGVAVLDKTLTYVPTKVRDGVAGYLHRTRTPSGAVNEIRLRVGGATALSVAGRNVSLSECISADEMKQTFRRVCGGAVYAHRDDICRGFISLEGGIRVGVCAEARYDRDKVVGVGEVSSLVFRIPSHVCPFAPSLYARWQQLGRGGMLICSGAGEGKTSTIRALSGLIGSGESPLRVVAVDERCEFDPSKYRGAHVDILRGYRRALGVDIAIRTLSAEVIVVDEVSSPEDSRAMLSAIGAGVTVIATAHARSLRDAMRREYIRSLVNEGLFDTVCVISRQNGHFSFDLERIVEL